MGECALVSLLLLGLKRAREETIVRDMLVRKRGDKDIHNACEHVLLCDCVYLGLHMLHVHACPFLCMIPGCW